MRILVVEDDKFVVDYLRKGLEEAGHAVLCAEDGYTGLDYVINESYDLVILDLMLPHCDGMTLLSRIRDEYKTVPVLILSAKRAVYDRVSALRAGSDDYLTKPFSFSELLARIDAISRRTQHETQQSSLKVADLELDLLSRIVTRQGEAISLQPREFALLAYLIRNAGNVVSRTMIMERVWNYNFDPSTNVVEARISKLREKIDKQFDVPLIHTVRGVGYVLRAPNAKQHAAAQH